MSTAIQKEEHNLSLPIATCIEIAYRSIKGELTTVDDIAAVYDISLTEAMRLITNPTFGQVVHNLAMANAKLGFDAIAFNKLLHIAKSSIDEKNQIAAIKTLADMTGMNESKKQKATGKTEVNINIDAIVRGNENSPFKGF